MNKDRSGYRFLGGWRGLRELLPNNLGAFTQVFASLKSYNFRLYFGGQCISLIGTWMQQIAMSWLVFRLTGSVLLLATVTFMAQIPILVATPYMSVFVDRFNRCKLLVLTQSLSMVQALLMALLTLTGLIQVWHIMILSLLIGLINALDNPTRQSFYPSLVPKDKLSNAIALNSAVINGSRLIGPAVGGVLIGLLGEGICFLLNGISYIAVIIALLMMRIAPRRERAVKQKVWEDMRDGFRYVAGNIPIRTLLLLMSAISFFRVALDDVYPGLRENDPARGERDARVTTFMYRCRFLHCGLVSGSPEERAGTGKSGDAFRGIAGDRFVGDVVCHDSLGGCRVMSTGGFHDYCSRGFHQHAVADPFR